MQNVVTQERVQVDGMREAARHVVVSVTCEPRRRRRQVSNHCLPRRASGPHAVQSRLPRNLPASGTSQPQMAAAARTRPHTRQPAPVGNAGESPQFKAQFSLMRTEGVVSNLKT